MAKPKEPTVEQLPALIDATVRQLGEARDLVAVREIIDRAEVARDDPQWPVPADQHAIAAP